MVRKPNIVRGIPLLLVRAMPTIYYYGRFASVEIPAQAQSIFENNIDYLAQAIEKFAVILNDTDLPAIAPKVRNLAEIQPRQIEAELYTISGNLSTIFSVQKDALKDRYESDNAAKDGLTALYRTTVKRPTISVVDTSNELEWTEKICDTLTSSCYYDIIKTRPLAESITSDILAGDFVLFTSATPQRIHEDIECLKTYKKPGLVLGQLKKDEKLDQQTIRNGAWLRSRGHDVLFKLFSTLRMFSTIDKIYVRFLCRVS